MVNLGPFNSVSKLLSSFDRVFVLESHILLQILISPNLSNLTKEVKRGAFINNSSFSFCNVEKKFSAKLYSGVKGY